jgi:hypothetical protein
MPRNCRCKGNTKRKLNPNLKAILQKYIQGCTGGTVVDVKTLTRELSNDERLYFFRAVTNILDNTDKVRRISQLCFEVIG